MTAFNVGDIVSYTSRGEWHTGAVEARRQELARDRDGNESVRLMIGIADAFDSGMSRLAWRDIRQCAAMIAGEHVQREVA